ncbi:SDR family oxidoreductase [Actinocrispum sp. NPDC049592]|uniref:SDR family NAD(P)-dependent oxidoreductase n=1 Tax=Actinocrispum sp. NPDC049592 TaxID=3154835 RepID=UPI003424BB2D
METPDYRHLLRLDNRHVVVLGAGQGIGQQTAHALAQLGARVTCVDIDASRGAAVAAEVNGQHYTADATDRQAMTDVYADAVSSYGPLHGVVNIVGLAKWAPIVDHNDDLWAAALNDNLRPAVLALQLGVPHADPAGASFVFVASVTGIGAAPNHVSYGAAKAGLMSLVRTAAVELGPRNIRVNAVAPGITWTPRVAAAQTPETRLALDALHPLGRVGLPADIAAAILFLTSDLSQWITGQTIPIDGGATVNGPYQTPRLPTPTTTAPVAQQA